MNHCSAAQQQSEWISQLLVPEPAHGLLSQKKLCGRRISLGSKT